MVNRLKTIAVLRRALTNTVLGICMLSASNYVYAEKQSNRTYTLYTLGAGVSNISVTGDNNSTLTSSILDLGFDIEVPKAMLAYRTAFSANNDRPRTQLMIGAGNQYAKLGIGFMSFETSFPSNLALKNRNFKWSPDHLSKVSNTALSIMGRVHIINTHRFRLTLDAFYGLKSRSSIKIPIKHLPSEPYFLSEAKKSGGHSGGSVSAILRLPSSEKIAVRLEYLYSRARLKGGEVAISGDVYGLLGRFAIPNLEMNQKSILLSLVVVI